MQVSSALGGGKDQEKELRICQNCLCIKEATVTKTVGSLKGQYGSICDLQV